MANRPASNDLDNDLSPQLRPVLSSLNISLEAELNRYRRNRLTKDASSDDVFADLDDSTFDVDVADVNVIASTVSLPSPPPVPPNRKLSAASEGDTGAGSIVNVTAVRADSSVETAPNGYLESSEKLIESLDDLPPMPEPVDIAPPKPRRKTVSLLAGAILGLLGLVAGLGVSYVVSSPTMTQKIAALFDGKPDAVVADAENTFDPPGPDLSEREFVDLELDNLSSLKMSTDPIDPTANPGTQSLPGLPPTPGQLPPIENQPAPSGIQAAVIPVGVTYYVTVPFTTEQDLINVRELVEEAFVRSFSDGNRIQIAAFDNPADAQTFVDDIKAKGITAFVYGPTTE